MFTSRLEEVLTHNKVAQVNMVIGVTIINLPSLPMIYEKNVACMNLAFLRIQWYTPKLEPYHLPGGMIFINLPLYQRSTPPVFFDTKFANLQVDLLAHSSYRDFERTRGVLPISSPTT